MHYGKVMPLIPQQSILSVSKHFAGIVDLDELTRTLDDRLKDYPPVRIISITATADRSRGTLIAVVETV